jgi:hypothetical protein
VSWFVVASVRLVDELTDAVTVVHVFRVPLRLRPSDRPTKVNKRGALARVDVGATLPCNDAWVVDVCWNRDVFPC